MLAYSPIRTDGRYLAHPRPLPKPDLSQLKCLRSLEVGDWGSGPWADDEPLELVLDVFSTIASPVFSEFVVHQQIMESPAIEYIALPKW